MYAWTGVSINVIKQECEGHCIISPGVQEKGRKRDKIISYTHPGTEFLCEMKAEQVRDCVTLPCKEGAKHSTQRTANTHSTHPIPRAYGTQEAHRPHSIQGKNTAGHTAGTQNTENRTQHTQRWYIGVSLTLQNSLGNPWLVGLRWYTLVGVNPKVSEKIFEKMAAHLLALALLSGLLRSNISHFSGECNTGATLIGRAYNVLKLLNWIGNTLVSTLALLWRDRGRWW